MKRIAFLAAVAAVASLAGCGGGGSSSAPVAATDAIPASATQSAQGLTNYLVDLSKDDSETKDPLDLSNFVPATSDTDEPQPVS